ncbi:MAG: NUDIX hydrolase [Acetobacteraceae bacterium]|jgi:8-oxo-dGTP pyrophosphatase MutT (NUDIX family)|nr:NUDIX hydrolase [Acetobacteraceae bacterium]
MRRPGAWRVAGSRLIHADRWIRLRADSCITPEGAVLDPYYVLEYADWVHVVAVTDDDRLVVNHQYRHGAGCVHLELPGGVMDAADDGALAAAARELREETGFAAREFRHITSLSPNSATHTNRIHTVLALGAFADDVQSLDAGEEIAVELLPLADIPALVASGAFLQSAHVASLMMGLQAMGRMRFVPLEQNGA